MSKGLPSGKELYVNPFKASGKDVMGQLALGPGAASFQRKQGMSPEWLNPADAFNGKLESQLTGDTSTDARNSLAKYGFAAAPWMPAMFMESMKKGDKIKEHTAMEQEQKNAMDGFNRYQNPYQRRQMQPIGQPLSGGNYNDLVMQLFQNSQMGNNQMGGLL